jgi:hypothetical protein
MLILPLLVFHRALPLLAQFSQSPHLGQSIPKVVFLFAAHFFLPHPLPLLDQEIIYLPTSANVGCEADPILMKFLKTFDLA